MRFSILPPNYPECPNGTHNECRFMDTNSTITFLAHEPEYDREGRRLTENPNTITATTSCSTCGSCWSKFTQHGETTFTRIN